MPELVRIPVSFFELAVDYERPALKLLIDRGGIVQGVFDALSPWSPGIDDIETHTTGKHSEQGVTIRIPLKRVSFSFGAASCRFLRDDVDWSSAEETITILDAALSALTKLSGIALGTKKTVVGMHLQPRTMTFKDILNPFLAPQLARLEKTPITTMAVVAKWDKRKVTLDGSAVLANAVFVKLEREFESATTYEQMTQRLRADEEELFEILGVEEDRG
jgi:hypothetical protein